MKKTKQQQMDESFKYGLYKIYRCAWKRERNQRLYLERDLKLSLLMILVLSIFIILVV